MDYSNLTLMKMMSTKMAYLSEKQDVLAQNIANADTPGYQAQKMRNLDFSRLAQAHARKLTLRTTSTGAGLPGSRSSQDFKVERQRDTHETTPVENSVSLEEQMAMVAQNNLEYSTVTNLYSKTASMFKITLGQNGS